MNYEGYQSSVHGFEKLDNGLVGYYVRVDGNEVIVRDQLQSFEWRGRIDANADCGVTWDANETPDGKIVSLINRWLREENPLESDAKTNEERIRLMEVAKDASEELDELRILVCTLVNGMAALHDIHDGKATKETNEALAEANHAIAWQDCVRKCFLLTGIEQL